MGEPTWHGVDDHVESTATGLLLAATNEALRTWRVQRDEELEQLILSTQSEIARLAMLLRERNQDLSNHRAELRELRDSPEPTPVTIDDVETQLRFIRELPGILGVRIDGDRVMVHVRTGALFNRRWYDFGDFEIALGRPIWGTGCELDIRCTRSGTRIHRDRWDGYTYHENHLYWSQAQNSDQTGTGHFCFGSRRQDIMSLRDQGRYAEMLHLVIASMNGVNRSHFDALERHYNSYRLRRAKRKNLVDLKDVEETDSY